MNNNDMRYIDKKIGEMGLQFAEPLKAFSKALDHVNGSVDLLKDIQDKRIDRLEKSVDGLYEILATWKGKGL